MSETEPDTKDETYRIISTRKIEADSAEEAREKFRMHADAGQLPNETWKLLAPNGHELEVSE